MDPLFFAPFIKELQKAGLTAGVREYIRVSRALSGHVKWTLPLLRDTMLAIFARNESQREIFLRLFTNFFKKGTGFSDASPGQQELKQRLEKYRDTPAPRLAKPFPRHKEPPGRNPPFFTTMWFKFIAGILLAGILVFLLTWLWPKPGIRVTQEQNYFRFRQETSLQQPVAEISNTGKALLKIKVRIDDPPFRLAGEAEREIPPGKSEIVEVVCTLVKDAPGKGTVIIENNTRDGDKNVPVTWEKIIEVDEDKPAPTQSRVPEDLLVFTPEEPDVTPIDPPNSLVFWIIAVILFIAGAAGFVLLLLDRRDRLRPPMRWQKEGPQVYSLNQAGPLPPAVLESGQLDHLADCLGYFRSEERGRLLDVACTVGATIRRGGLPTYIFRKRRRGRSLILLVDREARALAWNTLPWELAGGMKKRGVPVVYGTFRDSPGEFRSGDTRHFLDDYEEQKNSHLLLIFSDGRGLERRPDSHLLEQLARWPRAAWMSLEEERLCPQHLVRAYGIPVYEASLAGVLGVFNALLKESAGDAGMELENKVCRQQWTGSGKTAYLERLLGSSLPWAQACSMVQPLTPGIAHALRQHFFPALPFERIQRLYALPGTVYGPAGIFFAPRVQKVLQTGFRTHFRPREQEDILCFILGILDRARPAVRAGRKPPLALLHWQLIRTRVLLALEPAKALSRLEQLRKTPLEAAVLSTTAALLEDGDAGLPGFPGGLVKHRDRQRLKALQGRAPKPVHPLWAGITGILLVLGVFFGGLGIAARRDEQTPELTPVPTPELPSIPTPVSTPELTPVSTPVSTPGLTAVSTPVPTPGLTPVSTSEPEITTIPITSPGLHVEMVFAGGGDFMMGSENGYADEEPVHTVFVDDFYISKYEVTQQQWEAVTGENPSYFEKGGNFPVESVSWFDAVDFCNQLSRQEGLQAVYTVNGENVQADFSADGYRLPTEAEWEYAARGGQLSQGYEYSGSNKADEVAWYGVNSDEKTHQVGEKQANELGIYDMSGNVREWCWDWYDEHYYTECAEPGKGDNPGGPETGEFRVLRGGCWGSIARFTRSACRYGFWPSDRGDDSGLRLARGHSRGAGETTTAEQAEG